MYPHFIQQGYQNVENSQTHWKRVIIYLGKNGGAHVPCHFAKWQCNVCFFTFDVINFCSSTQSRFSISYTDIFQKSNYRYAMFCLLQFIRIYCEWKNATYCQTNFSVVKTGSAWAKKKIDMLCNSLIM